MSNNNVVMAPLPWQIAQWQGLVERLESQHLPHALLLHGTAGIGKGKLARLLALSLLCETPQQFLPCGQCKACQLFAAGSHPDFFLADAAYGIRTDEDEDSAKSRKTKKSVTPGKQIKIDCIRDLIYFGNHAAHQGGRRVAIIEPAEWLNHNAANALLKTLEEPGEGLYIILVSHQPSRLLPTLRSRCQALLCQTPSSQQSVAWLCQHISKERAEAALALTHQAPLRALAAVQEEHDLLYQQVMAALDACQRHETSYLSAAELLAKHDAVMILEWWFTLVHRHVCREPSAGYVIFSDKLLEARRKASSTANPNTRFLFEALLIDWIGLRK